MASNQDKLSAFDLAAELGILDLDDRVEFSVDPLVHTLATAPTKPTQPPSNGNCNNCATNNVC